MTAQHIRDEGSGALEVQDPPHGRWLREPAFPSGAGGLLTTADDLLALFRMLLADGVHDGRRVLSSLSAS